MTILRSLKYTPSRNLNFCYDSRLKTIVDNKSINLKKIIKKSLNKIKQYAINENEVTIDYDLINSYDILYTYVAGLFEPEFQVLSELTGKRFNDVVNNHLASYINFIKDPIHFQINLFNEIIKEDKKIVTAKKTVTIKNIKKMFKINSINNLYSYYNTNYKIRKQIFKLIGFDVDFSNNYVFITKINKNINFLTNSKKINENIINSKMNLLEANKDYHIEEKHIRAAKMLTDKIYAAHNIICYDAKDELEGQHDNYSNQLYDYIINKTRKKSDKLLVAQEWNKYQRFVNLLFNDYANKLNQDMTGKNKGQAVTPLYISTAVKDNDEKVISGNAQLLITGETPFNILLSRLDNNINKYNEYQSQFFAVNAIKSGKRCHDNVVGMKSLYLDFDISKILKDNYAIKLDSARLLNKNNEESLNLVYRFNDLFKRMLNDHDMPLPTATVMTGHGLQVYWIAKQPIIDFRGSLNNRRENLQRELSSLIRTVNYRMGIYLKNDEYFNDKIKNSNGEIVVVDPACADIARLLRVPYTFNNKEKTNKTFSYIIDCAEEPIDLSEITNNNKDKKYQGQFTFMDLYHVLIGKDIPSSVEDIEDINDEDKESIKQAHYDHFINENDKYTLLGKYYDEDEDIVKIHQNTINHIKYLTMQTIKILDDEKLFIPNNNTCSNMFIDDNTFIKMFTASPYLNCSLQNLTSDYTLRALNNYWKLNGLHQRNTALFYFGEILAQMDEFRMVFPRLNKWENIINNYQDDTCRYKKELRQLVDDVLEINKERNTKRQLKWEEINNNFYPEPLKDEETKYIYNKKYLQLISSEWSRDTLIEKIIGITNKETSEWLIARGFAAFVKINQTQYLTLENTDKPIVESKKINEEIIKAKDEHYWKNKSVDDVKKEINDNILIIYYMNDKARLCNMVNKLSSNYNKNLTLVFKKAQIVKVLSQLVNECQKENTKLTIAKLAEQLEMSLNEIKAIVRKFGGFRKLKQLAENIIKVVEELKEQEIELDKSDFNSLYEKIYKLIFVNNVDISYVFDVKWIRNQLLKKQKLKI